jgi:hypothetical protein
MLPLHQLVALLNTRISNFKYKGELGLAVTTITCTYTNHITLIRGIGRALYSFGHDLLLLL